MLTVTRSSVIELLVALSVCAAWLTVMIRKTDVLPNLLSWFKLLSVSGCNCSPTLVKLTLGMVLSNCFPISAGNKTSFSSSATIGAMGNEELASLNVKRGEHRKARATLTIVNDIGWHF